MVALITRDRGVIESVFLCPSREQAVEHIRRIRARRGLPGLDHMIEDGGESIHLYPVEMFVPVPDPPPYDPAALLAELGG